MGLKKPLGPSPTGKLVVSFLNWIWYSTIIIEVLEVNTDQNNPKDIV